MTINYSNYSDILKDEHFNNLADLVRVVFQSQHWKREHATVPFWILWYNLENVTKIGAEWNIQQVLKAFVELFASLTEADSRLSYTADDMAWLVGVLEDRNLQKVIIPLWMAYATAPAATMTPADAAEETGTSESSWRNRAAAGEIPGAFKRGKQWLIPRSAVEKYN